MYFIPSERDALTKSDVLVELSLSIALFTSNELVSGNVLVVWVFSSERIILLLLIKFSQVSKK